MAIVKKFFLGALEDESWPILTLEFKLLALRNKTSLQRMRNLYQLLYEDMNGAMSSSGGFSTEKTKERDLIGISILRGIPSALILEKRFNPDLISSAVAKQIFESIFDALLGMGNMTIPKRQPPARLKKRVAR